MPGMLAVIPARGGSKGLPRKNILPLAGIPLIEHSIRLANLCPEITRTIISTDSEEIAAVARKAGAEVPFIRPSELAQDNTPTFPVLQHALSQLDPDNTRYDLLLLLEPTCPGRYPADIATAFKRLSCHPDADGIVGVHQASASAIWHAVVEKEGYMADLFPDLTKKINRRQDAPDVYVINGALYIWRTAFVNRAPANWRSGRFLIHEIPEQQAIHIDTAYDLKKSDLLIRHGLVPFPWL